MDVPEGDDSTTPTSAEGLPSARRDHGAPGMDGSISRASVRGASWLLARRASMTVTTLLTVAVLARHLTPAEFGLVALASVILQFTTLVAEAGVGSYVVYVRTGVAERIQAAHWLNFTITCLQVAACLLLLPWVQRFNPDPRLPGLIVALTAVFFVQQFAVVPEAILQRHLRHRATAVRDIILDFGRAVASIALVLAGAGVWALVLPALISAPISCVVAMLLARWAPGWRLRFKLWREVFRYTSHLMGTNVLMLLTNSGDTLLVGNQFGSAALGIYNAGWQLSNLVNRNITAIVTRVSFPALALVRDDPRRMQRGFLRMLGSLALVCSPILIGMGVLAPELILTVYGPNWEKAAVVLQIFVIFTLFRAVTAPSSMVYNVLGRPEFGFRFALAFAPIYIVGILLGSRWGTVGVASAVTLTRAIGAIVFARLAAGQIALTSRDLLRAISRPFALAGFMGVVVAILRGVCSSAGVAPAPRLLICTVVGAAIYLAGIRLVKPLGLADLRIAMPVRLFSAVKRSRRPDRLREQEEPAAVRTGAYKT